MAPTDPRPSAPKDQRAGNAGELVRAIACQLDDGGRSDPEQHQRQQQRWETGNALAELKPIRTDRVWC